MKIENINRCKDLSDERDSIKARISIWSESTYIKELRLYKNGISTLISPVDIDFEELKRSTLKRLEERLNEIEKEIETL